MLKHKLQQVMLERDGRKRLTGRVEINAYLGGERSGGKRGRGAPGKTPFVAAVETTPEGKPVRLKLRRVAGLTGQAISRFALRSLDPSCAVVSDGLACFGYVCDAGCAHDVRLIPPSYVQPYLKRGKTDAADAAAICAAVTRPSMRVVAIKSEYCSSVLVVYRTRDFLVRQRTQIGNAIRAHMTGESSTLQ